MSNKSEFFALINRDFIPLLIELGFSGNALSWRRIREPFIDCVDIQVRSDERACCVNFGEHLTFLPLAGDSGAIDCENISSVDCEIKSRLAPNGEAEHWWYFNKPSEEVADLVSCFNVRSKEFFEKYKNFPELYTDIDMSDIEGDIVVDLLPMMTKVRRILFIARVYDHIGNGIEAAAWAEFGVRNAGMAVGPKAAFRKIIQANKQS